MTTTGWGQPETGKTSHFYDEGRSMCGRAFYRADWDRELTIDRPLGVRQCKRCLTSLIARAKRTIDSEHWTDVVR